MNRRLTLFFLVSLGLFFNLLMKAQTFEPWESLYKDNVITVEVSFKIENNSCSNYTKHKIQYRATGKLSSFDSYLIWTTDYIDCSGKTIYQEHSLNISSGNPLANGSSDAYGDTWPSQEDEFIADKIITKFYNTHTSITASRKLGVKTSIESPIVAQSKSKEEIEVLAWEVYTRLQFDIHALHILVKVGESALPKDTLDAYNKILKIRTRVMKGEDFNKVAMEKGISDDPSAKDNGGDLGYFTAMQMIYSFETIAYTTKVGDVSAPVRTRYGYHIIKVVDRRPAQGELLCAHIMIKTPPNMNKEDSLNSYSKATEIYNKLKAGGKFDELAQKFSDDKQSAMKGGELPWFGTNKMPAEFEKAAFALKNKTDYSEVMRTKYGYHIIKLLDKRGLASFDDIKIELIEKIKKDNRSRK